MRRILGGFSLLSASHLQVPGRWWCVLGGELKSLSFPCIFRALLLFETSLSKEETLYCVGLGSVGECVEHSRGCVED